MDFYGLTNFINSLIRIQHVGFSDLKEGQNDIKTTIEGMEVLSEPQRET